MRTMNADAFNRIANHPEVRPWIGMEDPRIDIDLTSVTRNPDNFAFLTDKEDGGYLVVKLAAGLYVAHSMALPDARGRPMASLMRKGFQCMFVETDAVEIVTQIPDGNQRAEGLSQLAGFRSTFRKEKHFPLMGERVGSQFKSLVYADWVVSGHSDARRVGQAFHEEIGRLHGLANHAHDGVHDQWVGATVMGCLAGNCVKAVGLYNRWAIVAGYYQATLLSANPPLVDTGDAVIQVRDGRASVLHAYAQGASLSTG